MEYQDFAFLIGYNVYCHFGLSLLPLVGFKDVMHSLSLSVRHIGNIIWWDDGDGLYCFWCLLFGGGVVRDAKYGHDPSGRMWLSAANVCAFRMCVLLCLFVCLLLFCIFKQ